MTINRRIRTLENKVIKPFKFGTTKILLEDPSEKRLVYSCIRILSANIPFNELTREQRIILDKASDIAWLRSVDVFIEGVGGLLCINQFEKSIFQTHLLWFIQQMGLLITQNRKQEYIFDQKGKSWKQKDKELKELYKTWKKPFTEESYLKILDSRFLKPKKQRAKETI